MIRNLINYSFKELSRNMKRNIMTLCGIITTMVFLVIVLFVGLHFRTTFQQELAANKDMCQINVRGILKLTQEETDTLYHLSGVAGIKVDVTLDISVVPNGEEEQLTYAVGVYDDRYTFINSTNLSEQISNDIFVTKDFAETYQPLKNLRIYVKTTDYTKKSIEISDYTILPADIEQSFTIMQDYDVFIPISRIHMFSIDPIGYDIVISAVSYKNVRNIVDYLLESDYIVESKVAQIEAIVSQIELCNIILGFVGVIIFVVAFFMIFNYVVLYLEDRYSYLGMLKAVGITNFNIFLMCFFRIALLCLTGSAIGGILALVILQAAAWGGVFSFSVLEGLDVYFYGILFILITGFLAVLYPAGKAAGTDVIELLEERS